MGLRDSRNAADRLHPYGKNRKLLQVKVTLLVHTRFLLHFTALSLVPEQGYGKSVYFWALVSALGTFFLGAGALDRVCHSCTIHFFGGN
jgi:hypothetical protein